MKFLYPFFGAICLLCFGVTFFPILAAEPAPMESVSGIPKDVLITFITGLFSLLSLLVTSALTYFTMKSKEEAKIDRQEVKEKLEEKAVEVKTMLEETTAQQVQKADETLDVMKKVQETAQQRLHIMLINTATAARRAAEITGDVKTAELADGAEQALRDFEHHDPKDRRGVTYSICPNKDKK